MPCSLQYLPNFRQPLSSTAALATSGVAAPAAQASSAVPLSSHSSSKKYVADPWKQPAVIDLKFGAALKSAKAARVSGRATRVSPWGSLLLVLYVGSFAAYMLARISSTISVHDKLFAYQVSACCGCSMTACDLLDHEYSQAA